VIKSTAGVEKETEKIRGLLKFICGKNERETFPMQAKYWRRGSLRMMAH
jgi:hypothetical protein